jgi:outer membrane protein TolC
MNVTRAESQVNHQRRMLRAEIINLYFQYIEALGIIELREAANQNQLEQYRLVEERFKKGESRLEDLLSTQAAVALASEALLKAQLSARKVKHQISLITTDSENHLSKQR